ncbi:MAG: pentapeptide repeat-containing protein [Magnetococcales bacterium]|nr:pentapeptide repeat-containing protein [Magnetococcales bacterium]
MRTRLFDAKTPVAVILLACVALTLWSCNAKNGAEFKNGLGVGSCKFCDLRYDDFSRKDLTDADFSGAFLYGTNFSWSVARNARFESAILSHARMEWADFDGGDFSKASMGDSALFRATFRNARMRMTTLSRANLVGSDLSHAEMLTAIMDGVDLTDALMTNTNLRNADLRSANLTNAKLRDADLHGAVLFNTHFLGADLKGTNFTGANLKKASFAGTYLKTTNFRKADLRDADFSDAILDAVNFQGAFLRRANFKGATIKNVVLQGADVCEAIMPDGRMGEPCSDKPLAFSTVSLGIPPILAQSAVGDKRVMVSVPGNLFAKTNRGIPVGVIAETMDAVLKKMGYLPVYVSMPISETHEAVAEGMVDIAAMAIPTAQGTESFRFTLPVIEEYNTVLVRKQGVFPLERVADLHGHTLGGREGYLYPLLTQDSKVTLQLFSSDGEMIRNLILGKLDAVIISGISNLYVLRSEGIMAQLDVLKKAVGLVPLRAAFSAKNFTQEQVEAFNVELGAFQRSPQWPAILERNGLADLVREWDMVGP